MESDTLKKLLAVVRRKNHIDQSSDWSNGSETYINEMRKELVEVEQELPLERLCYLEDELADVLWDYLNVLVCLETEKGIDINRVFERSLNKFEQRVKAIESGTTWQEVKEVQKRSLAKEHQQA